MLFDASQSAQEEVTPTRGLLSATVEGPGVVTETGLKTNAL
jgi:hypothetical protein